MEIYFITGFLDRSGNFLSLREFQEKYNTNTNFLTYQGCLAACTSFLGTLSFQHIPTNCTHPVISSLFYPIIKNVRGCRIIYDILNNHKIIPTAIRKWEQTIVFEKAPTWNKLFRLLFKTTKGTAFLWFQEMIFHRILATNRLLKKMNVMNNEVCSFLPK